MEDAVSKYDDEFWGKDLDDEDWLPWDELEGTDERWEDYEYYDDDDDDDAYYDDLYDDDGDWE